MHRVSSDQEMPFSPLIDEYFLGLDIGPYFKEMKKSEI
jgi:hypothetical protein